MQRPLDNQHIIDIKPLPSPRTIKSKLPITDQAAALVVETRDAIRHILHGQDRERLLVIVGPCSIHDPEAAYEYADRLKPVADALRDRLLIVMRTYFEKPRTTVGWKGLINDPHLDGTCDIATGMELARTILLNINKRGVPCAAEALDPVSPQYIVGTRALKNRRAASSIACASGTMYPCTMASPGFGRKIPMLAAAGGRKCSGPGRTSYRMIGILQIHNCK
ncbi:MAG: 3-deoxy-7-phosphoheptulonate synthase [Nitrospira sp.]|nr:MAG: 3-deoxy-7-phosphoheptulonate synthase [Nitrospira sp.]